MSSNTGTTRPIFIVLYTHQKTKKRKTWHDGKLKVNNQDNKAQLYDDNNTHIDTLYIKPSQVCVGAELESAKYLITIDDNVKIEDGESNIRHPCTTEDTRVQPAQPKFVNTFNRKRMGFTAPRQMNKTPEIDIKEIPHETLIGGHQSKGCPLFTTPFSTKHHPGFSASLDISKRRTDKQSLQQMVASSHSNYQPDNRIGCKTDIILPSERIFKNPDFRSKNSNLISAHHNPQEPYRNYGGQNSVCNHQKVMNVSNEPVKSSYIDTEIPLGADDGIGIFRSLSDNKVGRKGYQQSYDGTSDGKDDFGNRQCKTNAPICPGMKRNRAQILELLGNKKKKFQVPLKQSRNSTGISSDSQTNDDNSGSDNIAAMNLTETTSNITLTLDQSLTDELGDYFGNDIKEVFDTMSDNTERSHSIQETTVRFTQNQTEMIESQENNHEVYHQNTLCSSERTEEKQAKSCVIVKNSRNATKPWMKENTRSRSQGVENSSVISNRRNLTDLGKFQKVGSEDRSIHCINTVEPKRSRKKAFCTPLHNSQMQIGSKLRFPSEEEVEGVAVATRQAIIPVLFEGVQIYKAILTSAVREHLNIILFSISQRYHQALSRVDISGMIPGSDGQKTGTDTSTPECQHNTPAKMICVKKDGPNKGRFFYTCSQPRSSQCKFFLWADKYKPDRTTEESKTKSFVPKLSTAMQIRNYMKGLGLALHCGCQLIRKARSGFNQPNLPTWIKKYRKNMEDSIQKKLFLKLPYKDVSSAYAKDDLWVISSNLQFDPACSFIAKSIYHGPSSNMEIEIEPVSGYSPSNWTSDTVHSLLLLNARSELAQLSNIEEHITLNSVPVLPYLMDSSYNPDNHRQISGKAFKSPICSTPRLHTLSCTAPEIELLANEFITTYHLNDDQVEALLQVASMFDSIDNSNGKSPPITLIHGVFGAGKSFLLSVVVLFLVHLFTFKTDQLDTSEDDYWRLLISSTTNVAVDRILLGLLDLGFEDFIRVGSLRKISKPILPYSVHASDKQNDDIKELQEMLKTDLTPSEKQLIKRSLERQRLGHNKALLAKVKVVAVTCAACAFPCIDKLKFPVVLLDECSQMTEPASLLPIAKFHCEKLVLVGDPKQLPPTIQGSEAATTNGLEQTLFDRLVIMGIEAVMLRTQYRCHPRISALSNQLFYDNQLVDGVNTEQRQQLMDLPTLCFYNVHDGQEQCGPNGSYHNLQEVKFIAVLLQVVLDNGVDATEIGVITLYRAQAFKIAEFLKTETNLKPEHVRHIQISTVDAFQGGEKNVVLLSCVRTDYVGFIDSYKRTNVALTRSKFHLFIIGHLGILSQNQLWGKVINLCKEHPDGIQSAKQFVKKWKDKNLGATKTESKERAQHVEREAAGYSTSAGDINITAGKINLTEQKVNVNDHKELDDQPITTPINEWSIPVDSQGSPSYSPLEEIQASGSDSDLLSLEQSIQIDSKSYSSPSYSLLMKTQTSGSDSDLPDLEL